MSNSMVGHIEDLSCAKDVWDALESFYSINTRAKKIQLKNELNNMKKEHHLIQSFLMNYMSMIYVEFE